MPQKPPPTLEAHELHSLWQQLPDDRRLALLSDLSERAAMRLLLHQSDLHARALCPRTERKERP